MRLIDADVLMPNAEYKGRYDVVTAYDIANAPTIESELRKKGKWIDNTFCSECGWIHEVESGFIGSVNQFNFCPNCGADMRGEQNDTD